MILLTARLKLLMVIDNNFRAGIADSEIEEEKATLRLLIKFMNIKFFAY